MFKTILLTLLAVILVLVTVISFSDSKNPNQNQNQNVNYELVVGNDSIPTGELKETWYTPDLSNKLDFAFYLPYSGNAYQGIYSLCDGLGIIREGKIFLYQKDSDCYIVQAPLHELNSDFGSNLNRLRPVVELNFEKPTPRIILVDASLSPEIQGMVLAEFLDKSFYTFVPEIVEDFSKVAVKNGTYWESLSLDTYVNQTYPILAESGVKFLDDAELVKVGASYGSVFGDTPKTESDAYHRGRFIEMYSVYLACSRMKACEYSEYFDEFKQNNS